MKQHNSEASLVEEQIQLTIGFCIWKMNVPFDPFELPWSYLEFLSYVTPACRVLCLMLPPCAVHCFTVCVLIFPVLGLGFGKHPLSALEHPRSSPVLVSPLQHCAGCGGFGADLGFLCTLRPWDHQLKWVCDLNSLKHAHCTADKGKCKASYWLPRQKLILDCHCSGKLCTQQALTPRTPSCLHRLLPGQATCQTSLTLSVVGSE